jgi:shikimate dehydrogenase
MDEVDYISGETRIFGIVGHPIQQVRSPEMVTAELRRRGLNAILAPFDILPEDFERSVGQLMRMPNLDGLIFTIPFKQAASALVDALGAQGRKVGAINAAVRAKNGRWIGDIFDGIGCVEAFARRGVSFSGRRVLLIGAGGAGRAIAVAAAHCAPRAIRIFDIDRERGESLARLVSSIDRGVDARFGEPEVADVDIVMNASPVGMLSDPGTPVDAAGIPSNVVVFDAIVKPEQTRLLTIARQNGCQTILGREMMRGQISKIVDFFQTQGDASATS